MSQAGLLSVRTQPVSTEDRWLGRASQKIGATFHRWDEQPLQQSSPTSRFAKPNSLNSRLHISLL